MIPAAVLDTFTAIMLLVAAVSTARLAVGRALRLRAADADIDIAHLLMGIAMAGMLSPGLQSLPDGAWEVIFGALSALFTWRVVGETRGRPSAPCLPRTTPRTSSTARPCCTCSWP